MEVILTRDVEKLGKRGDVVNVSAGYARNFLFPKKLAEEATPKNIKKWEKEKEIIELKEEEMRAELQAKAEKIRNLVLEIEAKAGEGGRLFGSVTSGDIAEAIKEITGEEIDRKKIQLEEPIKSLGTFPLKIKFSPDVVSEIKVIVKG